MPVGTFNRVLFDEFKLLEPWLTIVQLAADGLSLRQTPEQTCDIQWPTIDS
mgnify:CR=1 FL=1|jgi:hypothetical protein